MGSLFELIHPDRKISCLSSLILKINMSLILGFALIFPSGLLHPSPVGAADGIFPQEPFNGLQITYSISGATVTESKDEEGFTTTRTIKGKLGSGSLSVSGSLSQSMGFGSSCSVKVWAGDQSKEVPISIERVPKSGETITKPFNLSVPIPKGATGGGFTISMNGSYSAGSRGLVVSGSFSAAAGSTLASPVSTSQSQSSEGGKTTGSGSQAPGPLVKELPIPPGKEFLSRVMDIEGSGNVYVTNEPWEIPPSQKKWVKVTPGMNLYDGYTIRAADGAEVTLISTTGAVSHVKEKSWLQLKAVKIGRDPLNVVFGRLYEGITKFYFPTGAAGAKRFEIDTERANTSIKGTSFILEVTATSTKLKVLEGTVDFTHNITGKTAEVKAGYTIVATDTGLGTQSKFDVTKEESNWPDLTGYSLTDDTDEQPSTSQSGSSDSTKKKIKIGPLSCFIATAAYGSETAKELDTLRAFRDRVLLQSEVGEWFVNTYYHASPPLAEFIAEHEEMRTFVREDLLDPIVGLLKDTESYWNN